jgi:CMP-N-acetylneuraminic acid synthetase
MKKKSGIILGLIPARGGSKGIKKKNIRNLLGKPLIAYAIECGLACSFIDKVVVSTDDPEIAEISKNWGADVPFMRPVELAQDNIPMLPVMQHALKAIEDVYSQKVDIVILLQPTSPLRKVEDIIEAFKLFKKYDSCHAVISGCRAHNSPYFSMVHLENGFAKILINYENPIGRRQDCPLVYNLDGTVWIYSREALMQLEMRIPPRTLFYEVPEERAFDIDSELDFKIIEFLMSRQYKIVTYHNE